MHIRYLLILCATLFACNNAATPNAKHTKEKQVYTQKEIIATMLPILKSEGNIFKKIKKVFAREAAEGEAIQTITGDGLETTNTAKAGDFIIKNQTDAGEMYIIGAEKFHDRYDFLEEGADGFSVYSAKGKVVGVEMNEDLLKQLNLADEFYLVAPWEEEMVVKKDDYLVSPLDYSEVYRIARKEFFETYQLDE
jgi:hypothetical protein